MSPTDERIERLERQVEMLLATVEAQAAEIVELKRRLGENSSNSNKPPSSDPPKQQRARQQQRKKSKRRRGGQPGHGGHHRELVPVEQVNAVVECHPPRCIGCRQRLFPIRDAAPLRHQVTEVPARAPHVTEYRLHLGLCACGCATRGELPPGVTDSAFGPNLTATVGLLAGGYRVSRRNVVAMLSDLLGVSMSLGAVSACEARVSAAVAAPADEALDHVQRAPVKHIDATSWRHAGAMRCLWVVASTLVSVFRITSRGTAETVRGLLGRHRGIVVSDRATAFFWLDGARRQVCWAHLLRKFASFSERDDGGEVIGRQLVGFTSLMFSYWHQVRDGTLRRSEFRRLMAPIRASIERLLERGKKSRFRGLAGSCADVLLHRASLWTFVDRTDVPPTNNHAEQQLRGGVIWRKTSGGSQSDRGDRFVERLLTVVHSLRKQHRHVLSFLAEAVSNTRRGLPAPSLLPESVSSAQAAA